MKPNHALLIVDLQKGFNPTPAMVNGILKIAKNYKVIVATKFENGNSLYKKVLNYPDLKKDELTLAELPVGTKVFKKTGYGVPATLVQYLKKRKITTVDVCGLETDACDLAAMFNLWDAGIQPNLLKSLASTPEAKVQKAALTVIKRNFGH